MDNVWKNSGGGTYVLRASVVGRLQGRRLKCVWVCWECVNGVEVHYRFG